MNKYSVGGLLYFALSPLVVPSGKEEMVLLERHLEATAVEIPDELYEENLKALKALDEVHEAIKAHVEKSQPDLLYVLETATEMESYR